MYSRQSMPRPFHLLQTVAGLRYRGDNIIKFVRREHGIIIGESTSEKIKKEVGSAFKTSVVKKIKFRGRDLKSIWSEQLNTTTYFPRALPISFVVSVFPVPAGPAGAPPIDIPKA